MDRNSKIRPCDAPSRVWTDSGDYADQPEVTWADEDSDEIGWIDLAQRMDSGCQCCFALRVHYRLTADIARRLGIDPDGPRVKYGRSRDLTADEVAWLWVTPLETDDL